MIAQLGLWLVIAFMIKKSSKVGVGLLNQDSNHSPMISG
jgi:hypothetical protein